MPDTLPKSGEKFQPDFVQKSVKIVQCVHRKSNWIKLQNRAETMAKALGKRGFWGCA
jgi:hypothetical protein